MIVATEEGEKSTLVHIAVTNIIKPITLHRERECVGRYSFCSACSGDTLHVDFVHSIHEMSTLLNGTNNCPFQSW